MRARRSPGSSTWPTGRRGTPSISKRRGWGLEYMDQRAKNPYYECLLPYRRVDGRACQRRTRSRTQPRQDDQLGSSDGDNWRQWGISEGRWGDYDVAGLGSSVVPDFGYAFAMNTYMAAALMTPVARYDPAVMRAPSASGC